MTGRKFSLTRSPDQDEVMSTQKTNNSRFQVTLSHDNPTFQLNDEAPVVGGGHKGVTLSVPDGNDGSSRRQSYDRRISLARLTNERLPNQNHYRKSIFQQRPSLDELHDDGAFNPDGDRGDSGPLVKAPEGGVKFGWITGVLIRCMLNIWGPIMFLRLTAIVGSAGILQTCFIIALSLVITTITALSISAISTNGVVKGGGTYYLISRSLGPEFGGAIGLIFSFANAVAVAMHTVGFAESLTSLFRRPEIAFVIIDGGINDMRVIGVITVTLLLCITVVGMEWEQKAQIGLLVILLVAIADVFIGSFMPIGDREKFGFTGWNSTVMATNLMSDYRGTTFFEQFSIFFPASTGILAGANISGDLKDPSVAIPKGTLLAIYITQASYIAFAFVCGSTVMRDAGQIMVNGTMIDCAYPHQCEYGLINSYDVMELISAYGYLIYAGCFAATLSSALACLVSAPKIFQALCKDKIYPGIFWLGKGYGKSGEAIRSYVLAFIVAVAFILIAKLNLIAPIISNFFMAAYALINFACFHAALNKSPGFRPSFRLYNMWVSLLGAIISAVVMFIMSWIAALSTFAIVFFLFMYISYKKPDVNWGSSTQASAFMNALKASQDLVNVEEHVKNYRPMIIVLTGPPHSRPALLDLANSISKQLSLLACGYVVQHTMRQKERQDMTQKAYNWFRDRKVKAFFSYVENDQLNLGTKALLEASGIGKLKPNMVMMGFMASWRKRDSDDILDYFQTIHAAFDLHYSVGILRVPEGLDYTNFTELLTECYTLPNTPKINGHSKVSREMSNASIYSESDISTIASLDIMPDQKSKKVGMSPSNLFRKSKSKEDLYNETNCAVPKEILTQINLFRGEKRPKGTIDVWWVYDDGGLTLLIPHILAQRRQWQKCKLRVFSIANKDSQIDAEQLNLASLLARFRITAADVTVLPANKKPQEHSIREFELMISEFREKEDESNKDDLVIPEAELVALRQKTERHIRIRELLMQHSRSADLVVITLPIPKKNKINAALYMAWLDLLSKDMPPTLMIRGNQTSVLTFYS